MSDRTLPHSLEAERSVLGAILIDNVAFVTSAETIGAPDFFRDAHKRIWDRMAGLVGRSEPIDLLTLKDELTRSGELEEVGGPAYISGLTDGVPRSANVEYYAKIIKQKSTLRRLIQASSDIVVRAYDAEEDAALLVDTAAEAIDQIAESAPRRSRSKLFDVNDAITAATEYVSDDGALRLKTGLPTIDRATLGLAFGELFLILARTASLKTMLTLAWLRSFVMQLPHLTWVVANLEMPMGGVVARQMRMDFSLSERGLRESLRDGRVDLDAYRDKYRHVKYVDQGLVDLDQLRRYAEALERDGAHLGGVIIDHAGLIRSQGKSAYEKATDTAIGMKQLARHLQCAVVGIVQANRAAAGADRSEIPVALESARDSGAYEENGDFVLSLSQLIYPKDGCAPFINAKLTKNRRGLPAECAIGFDPVSLRMAELTTEGGARVA